MSLSVNTRDNTIALGAISHFNNLSFTKNYQFIRKYLYLSAGFGAGLYYADYAYFTFEEHSSKHYGITFNPRLEFGLSFKKVVLSTGVYYAIGGGLYRRLNDSQGDKTHIGWYQSVSPYLRIIIK